MEKILILTTVSGFLSQFLSNDVKILQDMGYEIHYATNFDHPVYPFSQQELESKGIVLHNISIEKSPFCVRRNLYALADVIHILKKEQIGCLHAHSPVGGLVGRLAGMILGRRMKVIYTTHGFHFYKGAPFSYWLMFYPVERLMAHFTDQLITVNQEDYVRGKSFFLRRGGSVKKLPGVGLDTGRFRCRPELYDEMREQLRIPKDAFHIVTAAELNENKNQIVVIEALRLISESKDQIGKRRIYYSVCGRGIQKDYLKSKIQLYGLSDSVRLLGYRSDMEDVLASADCFVFPSYREGFGMAALEALGCGIPVVASENRGTREYIKDGVNGIFCDASDAKSFMEAICRLRDHPELCRRLGHRGRDCVKDFSKEASYKSLKKIYRESLKEETTAKDFTYRQV